MRTTTRSSPRQAKLAAKRGVAKLGTAAEAFATLDFDKSDTLSQSEVDTAHDFDY
jgi:hypothetical protein